MKVSKYSLGFIFGSICIVFFVSLNPASGNYFSVFTLITLILLYTIRIGSVSWFYICLSLFFFLGCWQKVAIHHIFEYPYIEPTGNFIGTDTQWDAYYAFGSCMGLGLISGKVLWQLVIKNINKNINDIYTINYKLQSVKPIV